LEDQRRGGDAGREEERLIAQPPVFIEVIGMVPFDSFCQISESCRTVPADCSCSASSCARGLWPRRDHDSWDGSNGIKNTWGRFSVLLRHHHSAGQQDNRYLHCSCEEICDEAIKHREPSPCVLWDGSACLLLLTTVKQNRPR